MKPPFYPPSTQRRGIEREVTLCLTILTDGSALDVHVTRARLRTRDGAAPEAGAIEKLDESAAKAVGRWKFIPGTVDGKATPMTISRTIHFTARPAIRSASGASADWLPVTPVKRERPVYPAIAAINPVSGSVEICFTVETGGSVSRQHVVSVRTTAPKGRPDLRAKTRTSFIAAAEQALGRWRFGLPRANGRPAAVPDVCQNFDFSP